jgi:endonuclease/exonuclease/phosphatase family metal-dependent hydrolase
MEEKRRKRSWFRFSMLIVNLAAAALLLCSYAASWISPQNFWPLAFLGISYPVLLTVNLFFVVFWMVQWNRYTLISLLTILLGFGHLRAMFPLNFGSSEETRSVGLKVLTFNVHSLYGKDLGGNVEDARSRVTDFLTSERADIVCIQEFYAIGEEYMKTLHKFSRSLKLGYFYFKNYRDFWQKTKINAIATFSRYPVVNEGFFRLEEKSTFGIFTDLAVGGDTIRVYNLHLESIRLGNDDYSFYSQLTDPAVDDKNFVGGTKKMIWKLRKAFMIRAREVEMLKNHMKFCPYPILICGDFNDTPSSYAYRQLSYGRKDAFLAAGDEWIGSTYAGRFPAFRIDYILFDPSFRAVYYSRKNIDLSDHYPVTAGFNLK